LEEEEGEGEGEGSGQPSPMKQRKPFDAEAFLKKWDEDNAKIEIPSEVIDDIDNDYDLEEVEASE
jgi:hypothetical protein